jgi:hypothetical protein
VRVDVHPADRVLHDLWGVSGVLVGVSGHVIHCTADTPGG